MGGTDKLADIVNAIDLHVQKANHLGRSLNWQDPIKDAKRMLKLQLTPDLCVPLETKMCDQVIVSISHMRHKKSGRKGLRINFVKRVDYEFEPEALADFSF